MNIRMNKIAFAIQSRRTKTALLSATMLSMLASPVMAQDAAAEGDKNVEVIQVSGILGSLQAAALLKRTDGRIVDAIVAEDIGKLPDNNIAEALQRITGVSINTDFGVGESVSIRGLSQNRVEINGRSTVGDSRGGVSLQDFPSSFLKSVSVVKTPTADMIEGALGGTVSMETVRPLALKEMTTAVSLDFEYADKTENWAPIFSGAIGDNWDLDGGGRIGAMLLVAYQDREIRQDEFFSRLVIDDVPALNGSPDGGTVRRDQNTVQQFVEARERTAVNLSFQYEPASSDGMFYLDLNMTKRDGAQAGNSILTDGGSPDYTGATQDGAGQASNYNMNGVYTIPKTWSEFRKTDSFSHAFGGEWTLTDNLQVSGEVAIASSESTTPSSEFNLRPINKTDYWAGAAAFAAVPGQDPNTNGFNAPDYRHTFDETIVQAGNNVPSIIFTDPNAILDPENLAIRQFKTELDITENDETAIRLDFDYADAFDFDWLPKIRAGIRATTRDYKFQSSVYDAKDLYKKAYTTADGVPFSVWIDDFETAFPGSITTFNHANTFDQAGLSGQNDYLTYRVYDGNLLANPETAFNQIQSLYAGTNFATTGSLADNMSANNSAFRDISEDTTAIYLQGHIDFDDITGIIGVRYVTTDVESSVYSNGALVSGSHDYSDVLPSLNLSYSLNSDTMIRFAAAKVMRRPDFGQLSSAFDVDNSFVTADRGALTIEPFRATQYDLSIEHYWGEGNAVSVALFYKDVASFFSSSTTCIADSRTIASQNVAEYSSVCQLSSVGVDNPSITVTADASDFGGDDAAAEAFVAGLRDQGLTGIETAQVTNGESGTVQGFELSYQQFMTFLPDAWSGLGVSANYTYADSEQPNGNPLLQISKNTFNAQVFWENDQFQARLAYNYRDSFLDTEDEKRVREIVSNGFRGNNYRDSRGQLDFSASYDVNEDTTIVTSFTNLTGEPSVFVTDYGSPWKYTEADRRMSFGVRTKF